MTHERELPPRIALDILEGFDVELAKIDWEYPPGAAGHRRIEALCCWVSRVIRNREITDFDDRARVFRTLRKELRRDAKTKSLDFVQLQLLETVLLIWTARPAFTHLLSDPRWLFRRTRRERMRHDTERDAITQSLECGRRLLGHVAGLLSESDRVDTLATNVDRLYQRANTATSPWEVVKTALELAGNMIGVAFEAKLDKTPSGTPPWQFALVGLVGVLVGLDALVSILTGLLQILPGEWTMAQVVAAVALFGVVAFASGWVAVQELKRRQP